MNKVTYFVAGIAMTAILAGCGKDDKKEDVADCVFPDAPGAEAQAGFVMSR